MMFFEFKKKKNNPIITEPDRQWVEDNFKWLIEVFGYPTKSHEQVLMTETYFPTTFHESDINIQNLIHDLSQPLGLAAVSIGFQLHTDLADAYGVPYERGSDSFDIETERLPQGYQLYIRNSLTKHPKRLVLSLIYELIIIRLTESGVDYDSGEDTSLFIYVAGVYFGFGVVLAQNLIETGRKNEGVWETRWSYVSEMPAPVMIFTLALYAKLIAHDNPSWKSALSHELQELFDRATAYLTESPSGLFNQAELDASDLFKQADDEYKNNNFDAALSTLQKILFLTQDTFLLADVHNSIGYNLLRKGEFEKSIQSFKNALAAASDYGYANDNLGYALIKTGKLEEGKKYLDRAQQTFNNDIAYTYRNYALYYQATNNIDKAEEYFKLAFDSAAPQVDLLELYYAEFLLSQGATEQAMDYLHQAVRKNEPEAIKRIGELNTKA